MNKQEILEQKLFIVKLLKKITDIFNFEGT